MRATALEFRLRMLINAAIVALGFWSPWRFAGPGERRMPLLEWLPTQIARTGLLAFADAYIAVIVCAALVAALAAVLRVWGSAWLGPSTVISTSMQGRTMTADGPYRYLRNPLYVGLWLMFMAIAVLMPPSGALVTLLLGGFFILRLTLAEEAFLAAQLGEPYQAYLRMVPRFLARLRTTAPRSHRHPRWLPALASEILPIGIFIALACFSFRYNSRLIGQVMLISFGASLVVRALTPAASRNTQPTPTL